MREARGAGLKLPLRERTGAGLSADQEREKVRRGGVCVVVVVVVVGGTTHTHLNTVNTRLSLAFCSVKSVDPERMLCLFLSCSSSKDGIPCVCFLCPNSVKNAPPVLVTGMLSPWKSGLLHVWAENETWSA